MASSLKTIVIGTSLGDESDQVVRAGLAVARKAPCNVLVVSPEAALAEGIADAITSQAVPAWYQKPVFA